MAERDAFGRLPDENPLEGLGAFSDGTPTRAPEPTAVTGDWAPSPTPKAKPEPAAKAKPAMSASSSAPRTGNPAADEALAEVIRQAQQLGGGLDVAKSVRTVGRAVKVVFFLVVLGIIAGVAKPIIDVGKDVRDAVGEMPSAGEIPIPGTGGGGEQAVPTGLSRKSMLRRANFDRAMKRLGTSGLGRMRTMSVRPERIDAQLVTKGGALRSVQIRFDNAEIRDFGAGSPISIQFETIPFAKITTGAPQRLARSAAGRLRVPSSRVDYVVLGKSQGVVTWNAYMKAGGGYFAADSRGRITRRIG